MGVLLTLMKPATSRITNSLLTITGHTITIMDTRIVV